MNVRTVANGNCLLVTASDLDFAEGVEPGSANQLKGDTHISWGEHSEAEEGELKDAEQVGRLLKAAPDLLPSMMPTSFAANIRKHFGGAFRGRGVRVPREAAGGQTDDKMLAQKNPNAKSAAPAENVRRLRDIPC